MAQTKNLCAQIPTALHAQVCAAREQSGLTTAQYITNLFLDLAAASQKMKVPADLPEYIMERDIVRAALRTAKEVDATDEEWQEFIDRITKRTSKNRRDGP